MDNITKFLQWTVGLLITLSIISAGILLWNKAMPISAAAQRQAEEQARLMYEAQFSAYDNQLVSGSQLLTAFRRYYNQEAFYLYVQTIRGTTRQFGMTPASSGGASSCPGFNYSTGQVTAGTASCSVTETSVTEVTNTHYVPPQARFRTTLVRDGNDRVVGIYFRML